MVVCEQLRVRFPPKASQLFPDGQFALVTSCRSLEPVIPRQKTRGGKGHVHWRYDCECAGKKYLTYSIFEASLGPFR